MAARGRSSPGKTGHNSSQLQQQPTMKESLSAHTRSSKAWMALCAGLWQLAWPLSCREVMAFSKDIIVLGYVGHMGPAPLSAWLLGEAIYNMTGHAPLFGSVMAMESFGGQAYGAKAYASVGVVLQRALALNLLGCCIVITLWRWSEPLLLALGQDATIAATTATLMLASAPALICEVCEECCCHFLAAQSVVQPSMHITMVSTMLIPLYMILLCRWAGLGVLGAAWAHSAAQATSLLLMIAYCIKHTRGQPEGKCTWPGWTKAALQGWWGYIKVAIPSSIMLCTEWWSMEVLVLLAGLLPDPQHNISMMGITINIHALCFLLAQGIGDATCTRVAQYLGAGRPRRAFLTVKVAVAFGTALMCLCGLVLLVGCSQLGKLFSQDAQVVLMVARVMPLVAFSLLSEGANTVLTGVLKSCSRQKLGAAVSLLTSWILGLPLAYWLAFRHHMGAMGLWLALTITAFLQAVLAGLIIARLDWNHEVRLVQAQLAAGELELEDGPVELEELLPGHPLSRSRSGQSSECSSSDVQMLVDGCTTNGLTGRHHQPHDGYASLAYDNHFYRRFYHNSREHNAGQHVVDASWLVHGGSMMSK